MRFFSPPEKPTFTGRFRISSAMPRLVASYSTRFRN